MWNSTTEEEDGTDRAVPQIQTKEAMVKQQKEGNILFFVEIVSNLWWAFQMQWESHFHMRFSSLE